jgi:chemotaxis protein CheX
MKNTTMSVEFVNPFVNAAFSVMSMVLRETPTKGSVFAQPRDFTSQQVNVVVGVTGQVEGNVILGMSLHMADKVASVMIGKPVITFDDLAASALAELGNMISGNAMMNLSSTGLTCDIAPPALLRGANIQISTFAIPSIVVVLELTIGEIYLTIGLQRREAAAA